MGLFTDLIGTTKSLLQIAIGGVKLGNSSGSLTVKSDNNADSDITVRKAFLSGDEIALNSDAAGSGADWLMTLKRPSSGMTAAVEFTLPAGPGSPNQVLKTDGSGNLGYADISSAQDVAVDVTNVAFGDSSPISMFNLPVGAVVEMVRVIIDTAFNGTAPTMSVGVAGTVSKYMAAAQVNLQGTAKDIYEAKPGEGPVSGSPEALIVTLAAGGATVGAVRVEVHYVIPA